MQSKQPEASTLYIPLWGIRLHEETQNEHDTEFR